MKEFVLSSKEFRALQQAQSVVINEFDPIAANLARVTFTSNLTHQDSEVIAAALTRSLQDRATPIRSSFRWLDDRGHAVGFVTLQRAIREVSSLTQVKANYKELAGNIFLDASDESTWEMKEGAGGKYLVRNSGEEDLTALLEQARVSPGTGVPRMYQIAMATSKKHELLAFVNNTQFTPDVDYGFVVESKHNQYGEVDTYTLVAQSTRSPMEVPAVQIVSAHNLEGGQFNSTFKVKLLKAAAMDKQAMIDYYKKLWNEPFAQDYLEKTIRQIEDLPTTAL